MSSSTSRTVRANIFFAEKDQALREDVHRLGELVGDLVREQAGEALFDLVEAARKLAIAHRESDPAAQGELKSLLGALAPSTARDFIRAFSTYFQMVNMAEQVHRIRRRRAYLRDATTPQPFGFQDICQRLEAQDVGIDELEHILPRVVPDAPSTNTAGLVEAPGSNVWPFGRWVSERVMMHSFHPQVQ